MQLLNSILTAHFIFPWKELLEVTLISLEGYYRNELYAEGAMHQILKRMIANLAKLSQFRAGKQRKKRRWHDPDGYCIISLN